MAEQQKKQEANRNMDNAKRQENIAQESMITSHYILDINNDSVSRDTEGVHFQVISTFGYKKNNHTSIDEEHFGDIKKFVGKKSEKLINDYSANNNSEFVLDFTKDANGELNLKKVTFKEGNIVFDKENDFIGSDPDIKGASGVVTMRPSDILSPFVNSDVDVSISRKKEPCIMDREDAFKMVINEDNHYGNNITFYEIDKLSSNQNRLVDILRNDEVGYFNSVNGSEELNNYFRQQIKDYVIERERQVVIASESFDMKKLDDVYRDITKQEDFNVNTAKSLNKLNISLVEYKIEYYSDKINNQYGNNLEKILSEERLIKAEKELEFLQDASLWKENMIDPITKERDEYQKILNDKNANIDEREFAEDRISQLNHELSKFADRSNRNLGNVGSGVLENDYVQLKVNQEELVKFIKLSAEEQAKLIRANNEESNKFQIYSERVDRYSEQLQYISKLIENHPENPINKMTYDTVINEDSNALKINLDLYESLGKNKPYNMLEIMGNYDKTQENLEIYGKSTDSDKKQIYNVLRENLKYNAVALSGEDYSILVRKQNEEKLRALLLDTKEVIGKDKISGEYINLSMLSDKDKSNIGETYTFNAYIREVFSENRDINEVFEKTHKFLKDDYSFFTIKNYMESASFQSIFNNENLEKLNDEKEKATLEDQLRSTPLGKLVSNKDLSEITNRDLIIVREATIIELKSEDNLNTGRIEELKKDLRFLDSINENKKVNNTEAFREIRVYSLSDPTVVKPIEGESGNSLNELRKLDINNTIDKKYLSVLSNLEAEYYSLKNEIEILNREIKEKKAKFNEEDNKDNKNKNTTLLKTLDRELNKLENEMSIESKKIPEYKKLIDAYKEENSFNNSKFNNKVSEVEDKLEYLKERKEFCNSLKSFLNDDKNKEILTKESFLSSINENKKELYNQFLNEVPFTDILNKKSDLSIEQKNIILDSVRTSIDNPAYLMSYYQELSKKIEEYETLDKKEKEKVTKIHDLQLYDYLEVKSLIYQIEADLKLETLEKNVKDFFDKYNLSYQEKNALREEAISEYNNINALKIENINKGLIIEKEKEVKLKNELNDLEKQLKDLKLESHINKDNVFEEYEKARRIFEEALRIYEELKSDKNAKKDDIEKAKVDKEEKESIFDKIGKAVDLFNEINNVTEKLNKVVENIDNYEQQLKESYNNFSRVEKTVDSWFDKSKNNENTMQKIKTHNVNKLVGELKTNLEQLYINCGISRENSVNNVAGSLGNDVSKNVDFHLSYIMSNHQNAESYIRQLEDSLKNNPYYVYDNINRFDLEEQKNHLRIEKENIERGRHRDFGRHGESINELYAKINKREESRLNFLFKSRSEEINMLYREINGRETAIKNIDRKLNEIEQKLNSIEKMKDNLYVIIDKDNHKVREIEIHALNNNEIKIDTTNLILGNSYKLKIDGNEYSFTKDANDEVILKVDNTSSFAHLKSIEEAYITKNVIDNIRILESEMRLFNEEEKTIIKQQNNVKEYVEVENKKIDISPTIKLEEQDFSFRKDLVEKAIKDDKTDGLNRFEDFAMKYFVHINGDISKFVNKGKEKEDEFNKLFERASSKMSEISSLLKENYRILEDNSQNLVAIKGVINFNDFSSEKVVNLLNEINTNPNFNNELRSNNVNIENLGRVLNDSGIEYSSDDLERLQKVIKITACENVYNQNLEKINSLLSESIGENNTINIRDAISAVYIDSGAINKNNEMHEVLNDNYKALLNVMEINVTNNGYGLESSKLECLSNLVKEEEKNISEQIKVIEDKVEKDKKKEEEEKDKENEEKKKEEQEQHEI